MIKLRIELLSEKLENFMEKAITGTYLCSVLQSEPPLTNR